MAGSKRSGLDRPDNEEVRDERGSAALRQAPAPLFTSKAFAAAIEHLIEGQTSDVPELQREQERLRRRCGQWLTVRRLALGLTIDQVFEQTGVDAETLEQIELGIAEEEAISEQARSLLCYQLGALCSDEDWVAVVADVALGGRTPVDKIMERVVDELRTGRDQPQRS